jgi:hypothetical protein
MVIASSTEVTGAMVIVLSERPEARIGDKDGRLPGRAFTGR